jgi:hypothetical protein
VIAFKLLRQNFLWAMGPKNFGYFPFGPGDGGDGNPLPSGMPSPEFGAGPGPLPALTVPKLIQMNAAITKRITHFLIL